MSLKNLSIKKAYSSESHDILNEFYIPVLLESIEYRRLAGFFSSRVLAIAARGIVGLISNGGTMKLIVSPKLSVDDVSIICDSDENPEKYITDKMLAELNIVEDDFVRDHLGALGWMLASKRLEIKVAIALDDHDKILNAVDIESKGLFHQKVGILSDIEGNTISFSGSINETVKGWSDNIEEFKVFCSWRENERDYIETDILKFQKFWTDVALKVKVISIPEAIERKLIEIAPKDISVLNLDRWQKKQKNHIKLFPKQIEAVNEWLKNNKKGIFEMATGTGKTITALGCVNSLLSEYPTILVIITCPYQHLTWQWKREIEAFGVNFEKIILADSSQYAWKDSLSDALIDLVMGYKKQLAVITTHSTFSTIDFIDIIQNKINKISIPVMIIGDEMHGLGALKAQTGLVEEYPFRLGLSATPNRWFDDLGTSVLYDYFKKVVYEFPLADAINTINPVTGETYLTPFIYNPCIIQLNESEVEEYYSTTKKILKYLKKATEDIQQRNILEKLLFKRADIVKNALQKYHMLDNILNQLGQTVKWTIVYCTPQQIKDVKQLISQKGITSHGFTMKEGTTPSSRYNGLSEREYLLHKFGEGKFKILVAMKCLDEGVDVPPARNAIIMASSGNPREYIQRIGRVLRRYPGKHQSTIYDMIVVPSLSSLPSELVEIEKAIFKKELQRSIEIASVSINNAEAINQLYGMKRFT